MCTNLRSPAHRTFPVARFLAIFLAAAPFASAEPGGPFYSPVTGFSDALLPVLRDFEKARIETTLRGFFARADSFPGFARSDSEPSEYGLRLDVAVRDAVEVGTLSDRTEKKGEITHRVVLIPAPKGGEQAIAIHLGYGPKVRLEVLRAIDDCIRRVVDFSGK